MELRITFTGAHGVGKTTAAKMLKEILREEFEKSTLSILGSTTRHLRNPNNLDGNYGEYLQEGSFELACIYLRRTWLQELKNSDFIISERWAIDEYAYLPLEVEASYSFVLQHEVNFEVKNCWDVIYYLPVPFRNVENDGVRPVDKGYQIKIDKRINSYLNSFGDHIKIKVIPNNSMEEMKEYLQEEVRKWKSIQNQ